MSKNSKLPRKNLASLIDNKPQALTPRLTTSKPPSPGRLFAICCTSALEISEIDRILKAIYDNHMHDQYWAPWWVVIDSLDTKHTEPTLQLSGTRVLASPFVEDEDLHNPSAICGILRKLCWQGSDIEYSQFVVLDAEMADGDYVLMCHSVDASEGEKEISVSTVKVGLEVLDTTMLALRVCQPGMDEIVEYAEGCEGGVYARKKA